MTPHVAKISLPEDRTDSKPDYMAVGGKVDALIGLAFADGRYVAGAIGSSDHPGKSSDQKGLDLSKTEITRRLKYVDFIQR